MCLFTSACIITFSVSLEDNSLTGDFKSNGYNYSTNQTKYRNVIITLGNPTIILASLTPGQNYQNQTLQQNQLEHWKRLRSAGRPQMNLTAVKVVLIVDGIFKTLLWSIKIELGYLESQVRKQREWEKELISCNSKLNKKNSLAFISGPFIYSK